MRNDRRRASWPPPAHPASRWTVCGTGSVPMLSGSVTQDAPKDMAALCFPITSGWHRWHPCGTAQEQWHILALEPSPIDGRNYHLQR